MIGRRGPSGSICGAGVEMSLRLPEQEQSQEQEQQQGVSVRQHVSYAKCQDAARSRVRRTA
jgi:hypothetical protein